MLKEKILNVLKNSEKPFHFFRLFDKVKDKELTISDYKKELKDLEKSRIINISKKDIISLKGVETIKTKEQKSTSSTGTNNRSNVRDNNINLKEFYYGKVFNHNGVYQVKVSGVNRLFNIHSKQELYEGAVVKIKSLPELTDIKKNTFECEIVEVVGDGNVPQYETMIAIHNQGLPHEFSPLVEKELTKIIQEITQEERDKREDLTGLNFITIDGDDSRDFDDAVYCETHENGWYLYVAIADVSHYVVPNTSLDNEAISRGTSVYFPNEVIPMLPFMLSNGLCSLNPEEERYALTVKINITKSGSFKNYHFMNSIIKSKARMTYNVVGKIIEDKDQSLISKYQFIHQDLVNLHELYEVLRGSRELRGALDFDKKETKIIFNEDNSIKDVNYYERNVSHKIIEECMLAANVCAAKLLAKKEIPALYRVHEEPKDEKLNALKEFLNSLGLGLRGGKEKVKPQHYKKLLEICSNRPDFELIQLTVLRSMAQAKYQPDNNGHFGLAYESYTHFTSPIRRYPDLLVHRAIKSLILDSENHEHIIKPKYYQSVDRDITYPYDMAKMIELGEHCSMTERRADDASRDVYDALKCHFLKNHIDEEFEGRIAFLTKTAVYIELTKFLMEGVIYYADLPDYFIHIPEKAMIKGKRSKKTYQLGDSVNVRIVRINHETKKVILDFVD